VNEYSYFCHAQTSHARAAAPVLFCFVNLMDMNMIRDPVSQGIRVPPVRPLLVCRMAINLIDKFIELF
jgi:hypothetical protein